MQFQSESRRSFLNALGAGAASVVALNFPYRPSLRAGAFPKAPQGAGPFHELRNAYDLGPDVLFLNHASVGTVPRTVRHALNRYLETCETNPWLYMWGGAWQEAHDRSRAKAAAFMGCNAEELVINHNTTEGFNLLTNGLAIGKGDEVLFSSLNHTGASACWHHNAESRGFTVKTFTIPMESIPVMTEDDLLAAYDAHITPKTKLLVFPHIDNTVGLRHPVRRLTALARDRGVTYVAVDGAQAVGMLPLNVTEYGVDFYAVSAHKWLQAPKGKGFLYVRKPAQAALRPMWVTWGQSRWSEDARKFEDYGTRDMPDILALEDAVDFQEALGQTAKEAHYRTLWEHCRKRVGTSPNLVWRSPNDWKMGASLYAVEARGKKSGELAEHLFKNHGAVVRPFKTEDIDTLRISPNANNTVAELDKFFDLLEKAI